MYQKKRKNCLKCKTFYHLCLTAILFRVIHLHLPHQPQGHVYRKEWAQSEQHSNFHCAFHTNSTISADWCTARIPFALDTVPPSLQTCSCHNGNQQLHLVQGNTEVLLLKFNNRDFQQVAASFFCLLLVFFGLHEHLSLHVKKYAYSHNY